MEQEQTIKITLERHEVTTMIVDQLKATGNSRLVNALNKGSVSTIYHLDGGDLSSATVEITIEGEDA